MRHRVPAISLDTVYRPLAVLESWGLVARVEATAERHATTRTLISSHFVCTRCGLIRDVYHSPLTSEGPESGEELGTDESLRVQLRGVLPPVP